MCLFCSIIDGEIPSQKVYEDDMILAFKDINPVAPVHIIIVPKVHIESANDVDADNSKYIAKMFEKASEIAKTQNISSYRIVNNCGDDAGQTVKHFHLHLIGGTNLGEKII